MTDPEITDHRKATRLGRRFAVISITISVLVVLGALGNLYHVQQQYQQCTADFLAYDSMARSARADASADADRAQQAAFGAAAKLIDPTANPTAKDIDIARGLFQASSDIAAAYDKAVESYPYQDFEKECLS